MNLRVLHVSDARSWRGGEGQVLLLCRGLAGRGIDQAVVVQPGCPLEQRAGTEGIRTIPVRMRGELDLLAVLRLKTLLRTGRYDIIHAHTAHSHSLALLASAGSRRTRLVVSRRVAFPIRKGIASTLKYRFGKPHFIAISGFIRSVMIDGGVEAAHIDVIHSGVDLRKFDGVVPDRSKRSAMGIGETAFVAGTTAALTSEKGIDDLVCSAAFVLRRFPHAVFVIAGDGPMKSRCRELAEEAGIGSQVLFMGFRNDIGEILSVMDLFVLPSRMEGLGSSVLDAMQMGLPVVASSAGGIPEMVADRKTGLLFPPGNVEALAACICSVIERPDMARSMGDAGKEAVRAFNYELMAERTLELYVRSTGRL
jgi:L-malate glycosyltransferase